MNIIGISGLSNSVAFKQKQLPGLSKREYNIAQGLDAAAALAGPQGIIAAAAEERFTREKATGAFPVNAIRYCLQAGNLRHQEVDFIAHGFSYESHRASFQADDFSRRQYVEVFSPEAQKRRLDEHFPKTGWSNKFVPVPHHLAHAASAFYVSGFDESLILISDGMGEVQSMTVAVGKGADITVLAQVPAFHSLGTLYGVFTLHLGFYMNSDEYKVMGLAPYGNSRRFFKQIMEFVSLKSDGTYTIPVFAQNHTLLERETHAGVLRFLTEKFGPAREPEAEITQSHKDIAAALQAVVQTCQLHVLRHFKRETGQRNVCLAGGVALNCAANGVIKRSELFDRVFVQPAAGDDGCALGAALYVQRLHEPEFKPRRMTVPLWGPEFSEREIRSIIAGREDCSLVEMESFDAVCKEVAARIDKGEIVAWFQGRMEFGPRALGSRSILADPRNPTMRDRINSLVKKREGFRPFAPVVTYEGASQLFEISPGDEETYAHMLFVTHTRQQYRDKLPATTHVDGSARVQTVARDHNPRLWQLNEFATLTGIPALLNTSFNVRGQPIVCTPQEAIETFLFANLDVLVLGNLLVIPRKVEKVPDPDPSRLLELEEAAARHEEFWVNRLSALEPVALPCKRIDLRNGHSKGPGQMSRPLPPEVLAFLQTQKESVRPAELLLAAFAGYLARITGSESFDISFSESGLKEQLQGFEAQFAASLPLRPGVNTQQTFADALALVRVELEKLRQHKTYALDLPDRHPALAAAAPDSKGALLPIAVQLARTARDFAPLGGHELMLVLPEDASECLWLFNQNVLTEETVSAMAEQFLTFLEGIAAGATQPLNRLSVLSDTERHKILTEWNDTRTDGVPDLCVHNSSKNRRGKLRMRSRWFLKTNNSPIVNWISGPARLRGICKPSAWVLTSWSAYAWRFH